MDHHRFTVAATALALPLTFGAWTTDAQAADIIGTIQQSDQFSTLARAIEQAGAAETLQGEGPFTVFAPTNEAFQRLPQGTADRLMQEACRDQLRQILTHHVVEGEALSTGDFVGQEMRVDTASGDRLTVDGTGTLVVLVPTGLAVARVGDEVFVRREVAAVTHPAVTVSTGGEAAQQGQQQAQSQQRQGERQQGAAQGAQQAGEQQAEGQIVNPEYAASERIAEDAATTPGTAAGQQQPTAAAAAGQQEQQQAATAARDRPEAREQQTAGQIANPEYAASENIAEDAASGAAGQQQQPTAAARTGAPQGQADQQQQQQRAAAQGGQQGQETGQPLAEQQGVLRAARIVEPDIQADNGIVHGINEILVPQGMEQQLAQLQCAQQAQPQGGQQSQQQ